jgi:hypothetical protein
MSPSRRVTTWASASEGGRAGVSEGPTTASVRASASASGASAGSSSAGASSTIASKRSSASPEDPAERPFASAPRVPVFSSSASSRASTDPLSAPSVSEARTSSSVWSPAATERSPARKPTSGAVSGNRSATRSGRKSFSDVNWSVDEMRAGAPLTWLGRLTSSVGATRSRYGEKSAASRLTTCTPSDQSGAAPSGARLLANSIRSGSTSGRSTASLPGCVISVRSGSEVIWKPTPSVGWSVIRSQGLGRNSVCRTARTAGHYEDYPRPSTAFCIFAGQRRSPSGKIVKIAPKVGSAISYRRIHAHVL